jgi:hypothetical protein
MRASFANVLFLAPLVACGDAAAPLVPSHDVPGAPAPSGSGDDAAPPPGDDGAPDSGGGPVSPDSGSVDVTTCSRTINVANSAKANAAIAAATPGDCVTLADGDYALDAIAAHGTATAPITIRAAHLGKATVSTSALTLKGAAYVTVSGLLYTSSQGIVLSNCDHCRLTRCTLHIQETGPVSWIQTNGSTGGHNRIDHNELGPKTHEGNLIGLYGSGQTILPYTRIDHNYFHDVGPVTSNGWETIRAGLSGLSHSSGFVTVESNLFERCQGDPEMISTKSCDDVVRYNTVRDSKGQISIRIGSRNSVYGNFILGHGIAGTGGIRIHGQDHRVFDNYIEDVDDNGVNLEGGESEETPAPGAFHYRVYRAQVVFNTIINAHTGVQIGGVHPLSPVDCTIANNVIASDVGAMLRESMAPTGTTYLANLVNPTGSAVVGITATATQVRKVDPKLVRDGDVLRLTASSPAIAAATGSFPFVTDDMDGDARKQPADVGADEYSNATPIRRPLTAADVGPSAP